MTMRNLVEQSNYGIYRGGSYIAGFFFASLSSCSPTSIPVCIVLATETPALYVATVVGLATGPGWSVTS